MDKGKARAIDRDAGVAAQAHVQLSDSPLSYYELLDALVEFLEVSIHTLLCLRGVYPSDVFVRRRKYHHPCYQSRHPGLNEYIARVLRAVRHEMDRGSVARVILAIRPATSLDTPAYERYVFALDYLLPHIDPRDRTLAISANLSRAEADLAFRAFLQKIMVVDGLLHSINPQHELTFALLLEMKHDNVTPQRTHGSDAPLEADWVPADPDTSSPDSTSIRPIKTLDSGVINLMLYVQEDVAAKSSSATPSSIPNPTPILTQTRNSRNATDERDIDQPLDPNATKPTKRKRARMMLGETRAQESHSESSDSDHDSHPSPSH